jgi:hypothetical protein
VASAFIASYSDSVVAALLDRHGARFQQKFTLEGAIGSHACSLEANMRVTNGSPLGCPLFLPVGTVNCVQTLKASVGDHKFTRCLMRFDHQQHFCHGAVPLFNSWSAFLVYCCGCLPNGSLIYRIAPHNSHTHHTGCREHVGVLVLGARSNPT